MSEAEIYRLIFMMIFAVGVGTIFRVKYLLRKHYPQKHDEIYGASIFEYSVNNSKKIMRFSMCKNEWDFVRNEKLLFWLHIYRWTSFVFYFMIFCSIMYLFILTAVT